MQGWRQIAGALGLLGLCAAFASSSGETPDPKYFPHPHYPPDLLVKQVEGQVIAHFKIDEHGRPFDEALDYDATQKPFAKSAADWLHSALFKVPKGWSRAASPVYVIRFAFVIHPHKPPASDLQAAYTVVVTGYAFGQVPN